MAPILLIAGLVLVHGIINWLWLADNVVLPGADRAEHLARSLRYTQMLSPPTVQGLFNTLVAHPVRPSLFHISAALAYALFGFSVDAGAMVNLLYLAILLSATYALGVKLKGRAAGLLATALVGTYPMIYAMSRYTYMEFALTAMVTATIYLLVASDGFQKRSASLLFGVCLGLGLLTKRTYVAFVLVPAVYVVLRYKLLAVLWRRVARRPHVDWRRLVVALVGGGLLASLWFFPNRETTSLLLLGPWLLPGWWLLTATTIYLIALPSSPESNWLASLFLGASVASVWYLARIEFVARATGFAYGDLGPDDRVFSWLDLHTYDYYLRWIVIEHISPFYAAFALLAAAILLHYWYRKRPRLSTAWWALLSWLGGGYALMTFTLYRQSRAILPLLPALALLTAAGLWKLQRKRLRSTLVTIMLIGGVVQLIFLSFSTFQPIVDAVSGDTFGLFAQGTHIQWPDWGPTDPDWATHQALLEHLESYRRTQNQEVVRLALLANSPYINASQFQPLILTAYPNVVVDSLTRESIKGRSAYQRIFDYDFVALKEENRVVADTERGLIDRLLNDPPLAFSQSFELDRIYSPPDGEVVYLYRKQTVDEAGPEAIYISDLTAYLKSVARPGDAILLDAAAMVIPVAQVLGEMPTLYLAPLRDEELAAIMARHPRLLAVDWEAAASDYTWLDLHAYRAGSEWFGDIQLLPYGQPVDLTERQSGARFGPTLILERYALPDHTLTPGDVLPIDLVWRTTEAPGTRLKLFVQLLNRDGRLVGQHDGQPVGGLRPTSEWSAGEVVTDRWGILLPADLPSGTYTLIAGWYPADGGDRLPVTGANGEALGTHLELGTVTVVSP
ncbi:MAG: glycosyltransferase family 39 protein [Anaerolineae bacterium]